MDWAVVVNAAFVAFVGGLVAVATMIGVTEWLDRRSRNRRRKGER